MDTILASGMCRCCSSEGSFKDLSSKYRWMGEDEVYAEMLRECFNVTLLTPEEGPEGGICEVCITQLRNAANFKKQVLSTEQHFQSLLSNNAFKPHVVKVETDALEDDTHLSADDNNPADDFTITEYEVPIKSEPEVKRPKRVSACSSTKQRADGDSSKRRHSGQIENPNPLSDEEIKKHCANLKILLISTNATLVRSSGDGYGCCFCAHAFHNPYKLKAHCLKEHHENPNDVSNLNILDPIRLDITSLKCTLCDYTLSLPDLVDHLKLVHKRDIFPEVKFQLHTFDFDGEIKCIICLNSFNNDKELQQHMMESHHIDDKKINCSICGENFDTTAALIRHKKKKHVEERRVICDICSKGFYANKDLVRHLLTHSGRKDYQCDICDKTYARKDTLVGHIRNHINERLYKCFTCGEDFVLKRSLKNHMKNIHGEILK